MRRALVLIGMFSAALAVPAALWVGLGRAPAQEDIESPPPTASLASELAELIAAEGRAPTPDRFPIWGIDASHYQGEISWERLARERRMSFAYLKATEGTSYTDARFIQNWNDARSAGLRVGAYHFFTFCVSGEKQAKHFLSVVPARANALPPVLDFEFSNTCRGYPDRRDVQGNVRAWLEAVEKRLHKKPVLYTTQSAYHAFLEGADLDVPLWVRSVGDEPAPLGDRDWTFWQSAADARVRGVSAAVDRDVFHGDVFDLEALVRARAPSREPR